LEASKLGKRTDAWVKKEGGKRPKGGNQSRPSNNEKEKDTAGQVVKMNNKICWGAESGKEAGQRFLGGPSDKQKKSEGGPGAVYLGISIAGQVWGFSREGFETLVD